MKSVAELFRDKNYELLARLYFDWVAVQLGNGDFEAGLKELARRYNNTVFKKRPFTLGTGKEIDTWLASHGITLSNTPAQELFRVVQEILRCFDDELKNRIEEELHHQNPLNP